MKKFILSLVMCITSIAYATATPQTFKAFPNKYFVETGTYKGQGLDWAMRDSFEEFRTIELHPEFYETVKRKYSSKSNVKCYQGDSGEILYEVIKDINDPITFWLDGHYSGGNTARGKTNSPILQELALIKRHHIKTHTILIDDVRQMGEEPFDGVTLEQIKAFIKTINSAYKFKRVQGHIEGDILVAYVSK